MSHEINETVDQDGKVTYSFARHENAEPAWHEFEVTPQIIAKADEMNAEAWLNAGQMNWEVEMSTLIDSVTMDAATYTAGASERQVTFGRPVKVFSDGRKVASGRPVTLDSYEGTSPTVMVDEALALVEVARAAGVDARIECLGETLLGNRQFVTVSLGKVVTAAGDDVEQYMNRISSVDCSAKNSAVASSIRTVCNNTIGFNLWIAKAIQGKKRQLVTWTWDEEVMKGGAGAVSLFHRKGHNGAMQNALSAFAAGKAYGSAFLSVVDRLAQVRVTDKQFWSIVESDDVFGARPEQANPDHPQPGRQRAINVWDERKATLATQWEIEKGERGGNSGWNALQPFTYLLSNETKGGTQLDLAGRLERRVLSTPGTQAAVAESVIDRVIDQILTRGSKPVTKSLATV